MSIVRGTNNNDTLLGSILADVIYGLRGHDLVSGNSGADVISGGDGNDTLNGNEGNDRISGGSGNDELNGDNGSDTLRGEDGNDTLRGGAAGDQLVGGSGTDLLFGESGNDTLDGGGGIDTISFATAISGIVVSLTTGNAGADGYGGSDTLKNLEYVIGSGHSDIITGSAVANSLTGGAGNDSLAGRGGNDTILGDDGSDTLDGGIGVDLLAGGAGDDSYYVDDPRDIIVETSTYSGALRFDGTDDWVEVVDKPNSSLDIVGSFTLEAWVEFTDWGSTTWNGIVSKGFSHPTNNYSFALMGDNHPDVQPDGALLAFIYAGGSAYSIRVEDVTALRNGDWHHIAFVYDQTVNEIRLYIDGNVVGTAFATGDLIVTDFPFSIGNQPGFDPRYFEGMIDDVRLWSSARTTDEIQSTMNVELDGPTPGLAGAWNFNEGSGTMAQDSSGNGNTGTVHGNPTWVADARLLDDSGTDTVFSSATTFQLPDSVENLTLVRLGAADGRGNALDNVLIGNEYANVLQGGIGADSLTGGGASDTFVYGGLAEATVGPDTIMDFSANAPAAGGDKLDISDLIAEFISASVDFQSLVAQGFLSLGGTDNNASTVINFDSDGSAGNVGASGTLVILAGLTFTDSAASAVQLADNLVTA